MKNKKNQFLMFIILIFVTAIIFAEFGPPEDVQITQQVKQEDFSFFEHDIVLKIGIISILLILSISSFILFQKKKWIRKGLLISSVIVIGFFGGGFLCPVSAVQNVLFKAGTAYLILFLIPLISTAIFGRFYCGYVCPFGALSELLHVKKLRISVNKRWDKILKYLKYIILIILILRIFLGSEAVSDLTPFKALFSFGGTWLNWTLTGFFIGLSVFFYRPFCKYLCPYGALMALINRFSLFKIKSDESCVNCTLCVKKCPMNAMEDNIKTNSECIFCGECCQNCPKDSLNASINK
ncbi:MAG TPA: 4Fe-4S binding protein [Thermotogota bacterium]|nr:4Fe-4S binding protein [Thermotogota bacterium]